MSLKITFERLFRKLLEGILNNNKYMIYMNFQLWHSLLIYMWFFNGLGFLSLLIYHYWLTIRFHNSKYIFKIVIEICINLVAYCLNWIHAVNFIFHVFRLLFWSDVGAERKIERSNLDGNLDSRETFYLADNSYPSCLELDRKERKIYWIERSLDKILYMTYEGKERTLLKGMSGVTLYDMALFRVIFMFIGHNCWTSIVCLDRFGFTAHFRSYGAENKKNDFS
jgi:hypothetical protein